MFLFHDLTGFHIKGEGDFHVKTENEFVCMVSFIANYGQELLFRVVWPYQ